MTNQNMGKFICKICGKELLIPKTCDSMSTCAYVDYSKMTNEQIRRQLSGGNLVNNIER